MHMCRSMTGPDSGSVAAATLLIILAAGGLHAGAEKRVKPHKETRRSDSHQIEAMEEQWRDALVKNDAGTIEKMTTDDFLSISSNGTLSDKQQYLHRLSSNINHFSTIDLMVLKVRVQAGSAIATSQTHTIGSIDGHPVDAIFRYTKVYTRLPGGPWRVANFEATRVSKPQAGDLDMHHGLPLNTSPAPEGTH